MMLLPQQQQPAFTMSSSANTTTTPKQTTKTRGYDNAPIFLKKTYEMIDTCDPDIATWSDDGTTFVVKNPEKLESEEIPKFFNHRNFSSFVRQLNFYGFRKIKTDPIRISNRRESCEDTKHWVFRHEKFMRGRPDLLSEVKKANQVKPASQGEVDALKEEVRDLKNQLANMSKDMERLIELVGSITRNQEYEQQRQREQRRQREQADRNYAHHPATKKRRISSITPSPVKSQYSVQNNPTIRPLPVTSLPPGDRSNTASMVNPSLPPPPASHFSYEKDDSMGSLLGALSEYDEDFIASLLTLDDDVSSHVDENKKTKPMPDLPPSKLMQMTSQ